MISKVIVVILLGVFVHTQTVYALIVQVEQGLLQGERIPFVDNKNMTYCSFKGIPYAKPPVGMLRFKAPQPPVPWTGVRNATMHRSVCLQRNDTTTFGNEDCLYLNVYTKELKPKSPLPVMLFIHGGGFFSGSGNTGSFGPDFLVNHGVLLVTFNYRLDALGYLCLDNKEVPGNAGMKDQVAAFKWVQKNIDKFGGDPKNVTIFGESAGGTSVALHVLSPLSKGLFKRAITMSGVPTCDWALPFEPKRRAFRLGKILGFETEDPNKLLDYMQSLPAEKLVGNYPSVLAFEDKANHSLKLVQFTPVVEKACGKDHFLTEDPIEALKKGHFHDVEALIGVTSQESLIDLPFYVNKTLPIYNKYPEVFVPRKLLITSTPTKILELSDRIRKRYFGDMPINIDAMKEFVIYLSDSSLVYDISKYTKLWSKVGSSKKYFYRFSCVSKRNVYGNVGAKYGIIGASHADDTMYLFDPRDFHLKIDKGSREYYLVQLTCTVFSNFAKYGTPTPDKSLGVIWPEYDSVKQQYVDIGDTLTAGQALDADVIAFWDSIYADAGVNYYGV